ncbi:hypothetical protein [Corynebacterium meitnerae]|uniref:Uncharacterized protein n=1 Tax=Corynebacterium meitnerae TaxID=2913498 RepID=A0A9X3LXL9_9CORY|nr:hypothetical protein [Corynebacterium meitnerae]MCZ9294638.1 hypothetical protein [Corynebacterium meitnerae]
MINESWPWKRDLWLAAERIENAKFNLADQLDNATLELDDYDFLYSDPEAEILYQVERDVLLSAYAMRRLIGIPTKMTREVARASIDVVDFPLREAAKSPDFWDALGDIDIYDLQSPKKRTVTVQTICNYFVHSLFLRFAWTIPTLSFEEYWALDGDDVRTQEDPRVLAGWLVASDRSSKNALTYVPLDDYVSILKRFAHDEVTTIRTWTDPDGIRHYETS